MKLSLFTIAALMIALGVVPHLIAFEHGAHPSPLGLAVSAALCAGGLLLLLRRWLAFWVALVAGVFTAATGVAGMVLGREVGLPLQPIVTLVAGLYVCLRVTIARAALSPVARSVDERDAP